MAKVLISDKLDEEGRRFLEQSGVLCDEKTELSPDELKSTIAEYDGIIVRSKTKLTAEIIQVADSLKIIGRAGTGVDNVDLEAATQKGVLVVNAPESNIHSTAELTFSMLLALSRNIPQACSSVKSGNWKKQQFAGVQLAGKTMGILGFGRIGSQIAGYASAFGMKVLVNDPFVSESAVKQVGAVTVDLDTLLGQSDFITVHTPLTPETKGILDRKAFGKMKSGVKIINCARGGIIDEEALVEALQKGTVGGAALDVFEQEPPEKSPLLKFDNVIATPHLGASTAAAQKNVAVEIAKRIAAYFANGDMNGAVNLPQVDQETLHDLEPYLILCEKLGSFSAQLMSGQIKNIGIDYRGELGSRDTTVLTRSVLKGFLGCISEEPINFVNATVKARERGLKVTESKSSEIADFAALIKVTIQTDRADTSVAGTIFGAKNDPRIVRINDFHVDAIPSGTLIIIHNWDRPGTVGKIGSVLGDHKINIADMTLGRNIEQDKAVVLINLDGDIDREVLKDLQKIDQIIEAKIVSL